MVERLARAQVSRQAQDTQHLRQSRHGRARIMGETPDGWCAPRWHYGAAVASGQRLASIFGATLMGEPSTLAEHVYAAYSRGDLDACLRLFAPDCKVTFPGMPPLSGPEQSRPFLQVQLEAFPNGRHTVRSVIEQGSNAAM